MIFLTRRGRTSGLPQGTLPGLILQNSLPNDKKRLSSEVTRLFRRQNRRHICEELQKNLIKVSNWVINQKKKLNGDKCSNAHGRKFWLYIMMPFEMSIKVSTSYLLRKAN